MKSAITSGLVDNPDPRFGGFNDFPPNWASCNANTFWQKFNIYGPGKRNEHRQLGRRDGKWVCGQAGQGSLLDAHLFFYDDDTGLAIQVEWSHAKNANDGYLYTPKFYKFYLCEHDYETTQNRMHYWEGKCRKCGYVNFVDSSG